MSTTFKFEHFASMSAATLTNDDGGSCFIFCAIPGGTPQFQFDRSSQFSTRVEDAPEMSSHKAFKAFILQRFAD